VGPEQDDDDVEIILPGPGIAITKTLVDPPGGVAVVSDTITFTIRIDNVGQTAITSLSVTDTYDSNYLTLTSYSVTPDDQTAGIITWTNALTTAGFLPLAPGGAFTITIDFHAHAPTTPGVTINYATVEGIDEYHAARGA